MALVTLHDKQFGPFISDKTIAERVRKLGETITNEYKSKDPVFIIVLNGAFMFASDLLKQIDIISDLSFIKVKSYEGTESTGAVRDLIGMDYDLKDRNVIIIEDIVDTGVTLEYLFDTIKKQGPASLEIATLLFKKEAYQKNLPVKYVGFEVPNAFVVGYGLDYDGLGRNIPEILTLEKNRKNMLNIVLFGPPGAGKGTQSEMLKKKYDLVHLSTGDIFRANIKGETTLGKQAKAFIDQGKLVPDELTIGLLESELDKYPDANGFIFDGFPRTDAQADALDTLLASKGSSITMMLALDVPEDELKQRLLERAKTSGRADDADPAVIANRIEVYKKETAPVKSFYDAQSKFHKIDGLGSIDDITNRLFDSINGVLEHN